MTRHLSSRMRPTQRRPIALLVFVAALLFGLGTPRAASAGELRTEHFIFFTAPGKEAIAHELAKGAEGQLRSVARQLGTADAPQPLITVQIAHGAEAFARLMPKSGMTDWAAGVAFPRDSIILLRVDARTRFDLNDIFRHEISHIALSRAVGHAPLPTWFIEGVAVHQAGEKILDRWRKTATATLTDSVLPLHELDSGFPSDATKVDLAYAQSTSFVTWLIAERGWPALRQVIEAIQKGAPFRSAFRRVYGGQVEQLEHQWRQQLSQSASWIPVIFDQALWWILMSLLFVVVSLVVVLRRRSQAAAQPRESPDDEFA